MSPIRQYGNSLAVQWFRFHNYTAGGRGLIPGQETKIKIMQAVWRGKKKKKDNLIVLGIFLAPLQCLVNQGEPWNQSCSSYMSQEPKAQSRLYLQPMSLTLSTQLDIMVIWSTWILKNSFHQDHIVLEVVHYSPRPETKAFILKRPNQGLVYPLNSLRHSQMPEDAFRRNKTPK